MSSVVQKKLWTIWTVWTMPPNSWNGASFTPFLCFDKENSAVLSVLCGFKVVARKQLSLLVTPQYFPQPLLRFLRIDRFILHCHGFAEIDQCFFLPIQSQQDFGNMIGYLSRHIL